MNGVNSLLRNRHARYSYKACDWNAIHKLLSQIQLFSVEPQYNCNMYETLRELVLIAILRQDLDQLKSLYNFVVERAPDKDISITEERTFI